MLPVGQAGSTCGRHLPVRKLRDTLLCELTLGLEPGLLFGRASMTPAAVGTQRAPRTSRHQMTGATSISLASSSCLGPSRPACPS